MNARNDDYPPTLGLVLAGGLARRMGGGDKAFLKIGNETILARSLSRFRPQCETIVINANGDANRFAEYDFPVVADDIPDFAGPLAGILAGLDWTARHKPKIEWIASVPGDCPFIPRDLVSKLHAVRASESKPLACARSGEWQHHVVALWPVSLRADLRQALVEEGLHKTQVFTHRYGVAIAEWPDTPLDPFFNVNTPEDLAKAESLAREYAN